MVQYVARFLIGDYQENTDQIAADVLSRGYESEDLLSDQAINKVDKAFKLHVLDKTSPSICEYRIFAACKLSEAACKRAMVSEEAILKQLSLDCYLCIRLAIIMFALSCFTSTALISFPMIAASATLVCASMSVTLLLNSAREWGTKMGHTHRPAALALLLESKTPVAYMPLDRQHFAILDKLKGQHSWEFAGHKKD